MAVRFTNPQFLRAVNTAREVPESGRLVVFAGRSNAGKSSVINALCGGGYARVSRTPGRTRMINLFDLGDLVFADLPGYGYARVSKKERSAWGERMAKFLQAAPIACLVAIIDSRRGIGDMDEQLFTLCAPRRLPTLVILNKADKLKQRERREVMEAHQHPDFTTLLFSAVKKQGVDAARQFILANAAG